MSDVCETKRLLSEVYTAEGVEIWLNAPSRWFDGRVPLELIELGRGDEVLRVARALAEGVW